MGRLDTSNPDIRVKIEEFTEKGLPAELYTRVRAHASSFLLVSKIEEDCWVFGMSNTASGVSDVITFFLKNIIGIRGDAFENIAKSSEQKVGTKYQFKIDISTLKKLLPQELSQPEPPSLPPLPQTRTLRADVATTLAQETRKPLPPRLAPTPSKKANPQPIINPDSVSAKMKKDAAMATKVGIKGAEEARNVARKITDKAKVAPDGKLSDVLNAFGLGQNRKKHMN